MLATCDSGEGQICPLLLLSGSMQRKESKEIDKEELSLKSHYVIPLVKLGLKLILFLEFSFEWAQISLFYFNKFGLDFLSLANKKYLIYG